MKPTLKKPKKCYSKRTRSFHSRHLIILFLVLQLTTVSGQSNDTEYATVSTEQTITPEQSSSPKQISAVTISEPLENLSILDVFIKIENATNFKFSYDNNDINKEIRVSIDTEGKTVADVLSTIANQTSLTFKQLNNDIVVRFHEKKIAATAKSVDRNIAGTVTDKDGITIPGVNIVVKGTAIGTITDIDGKFTLSIPENADTLIVSFVGYLPQYIAVGNQTTFSIVLEEDIKALEELVVIGYQTIKKKDLTGSVFSIEPKKASEITTNSVVESLQGLAPGVTVRNSGRPGQMGNISIRGIGSFRNTAPLYIIDGMYADPNSTINPNDIASINILKDASATAIYGSRAAAGVVIITTKQGTAGPTKIGFSAKRGLQEVPRQWDVMNSQQFAATQRLQYENMGLIPPTSVGSEFDTDIDTDWQNEGFRIGTIQDYNVNISGGNDNSTFLVSGSWFDNEGTLIGNDFERASLRVNTTAKKGIFFFGQNAVLTRTVDEAPATGNAFYDLPQLLPIIDVQNNAYIEEGINPEGWGFGRPDAVTYAWNYPAINSLNKNRATFSKVVGNAFAGLKFTDYLEYKFNVGVEASFDHIKNVRKDGNWSYAQSPVPNSVTETRGQFNNILLEHTLNFNKDFGKHHIDGVVGFSQQEVSNRVTVAGRTNMQIFNGEYLTEIDAATGEDVAFGGLTDNYIIRSFLGRLNYIYDERYLLTLTGRSDADSRFGEDYRTGYFPSVAAAWRISRESFFNVSWINNLKLYASYGILGINTIGPFEYTGYLNSNPRAVFGQNQNVYSGAYMAQLFNPDLRWEERKMTNLGITASFWEDKFTTTIEVYNSVSDDALVNVPLPGYLGNLGGDPAVNAASIRNRGIEFSATYRNYEHKLKWEISGNFTTIQNEILRVANVAEGNNYLQFATSRAQAGYAVGEWYLLETDGIFQNQDEIEAHTDRDGNIIQPNAQPGDIRFIDHDGDGQITDEDRTFRGSPWPKIQAGLQFAATYGQFSMSLQFVGVFGQMIYNDTRRILDSYQNTNFRTDINPWTPTNTNTDDPRLGLESDPGIADNNRPISDRWLENGSYFRLRNIEIGYTLPASVLNRIKFDNIRVFVSAQNLLTITKYTGLDPDIPGRGIGEPGFDGANWPASRIVSVGLQCGF